jgi:ribosomal protein S18 acetylase RimI-like enzyme
MHGKIRPATAHDVRAIAEINVAAWRTAYRGLVGDEELSRMSVDERERRWTEILTGNESRTFVAELGGPVAGYCSIFEPTRDEDGSPETAEIAALDVSPDRWRAGIGSALLEHALAELDGHWKDMTLWVFAANGPARAFYARHGFEDAGEPVDDYSGQPVVRLRRRLGQP